MPTLVNGKPIPIELIRAESERLSRMEDWKNAAAKSNELDYRLQLRQAAERAAIDKVLIINEIQKDTRPLDQEAVDREVERAKRQGGCRPGFNESALRENVEATLRYQRTASSNL